MLRDDRVPACGGLDGGVNRILVALAAKTNLVDYTSAESAGVNSSSLFAAEESVLYLAPPELLTRGGLHPLCSRDHFAPSPLLLANNLLHLPRIRVVPSAMGSCQALDT